MIIKGIVLIQRDGRAEFKLNDVDENGLCHFHGITVNAYLTLSLFHVLNALNTPNGAWSLKMPEGKKFIYDNEVWVKGRILSEYENNCDLIEISEVGHPRELTISRFNQIKKRVFQ